MTLHDPQDVADTLAEQLARCADDMDGISEVGHLSWAIMSTCTRLGVVPGDVYPVISDAVAMLGDDEHRTVAIHVGPAQAQDLLQALDTFGEANPDDPGVRALWQVMEAAAVRLGAAGTRREFPS